MPNSTHRGSQSPKPSPKPHHLSPQPNPPSPQPSLLHESTQADSTTTIPFNPLFTLLTTHPTSKTHHPTIHYLFSDDDPSLLTSAALSTLSSSPPSPASPHEPSRQTTSPTTSTPNRGEEGGTSKEHILLIDLDASGTRVTNAQSMSPEWAITNAEIGAAPTWGEEREGDGKGGLMLRIEGVEARRGGGKGMEKGKEKGVELDVEGFEGLMERFQRGMEGLRRVVEAGERWEGLGGEAGGE